MTADREPLPVSPKDNPDALAAVYAGKRVLVTGASGFLGGVVLSLLLNRASDVDRVFVLIRKSPGLPAARRFSERVLPGPAFDPLRERWEEVAPAVTVLQGDLTQPDLGLDDAGLAELGRLDLILNCAGLVDFNAPLDQAHRVNIQGARHVGEFALRLGAHLAHVSTCFVAGGQDQEPGGPVDAPVRVPETAHIGFFPRQSAAGYLEFSPEREIADLEAEIARIEQELGDQAAQARFGELARQRALAATGALPAGIALANAGRRIQRDETTARLVASGKQRAAFWGWSNVYTYSKSIGEQVLLRLAAERGLSLSLVRPAIIESALAYPEPGFNQNATTSAPLVGLALAGFRQAPTNPDLVLDIVPVDRVASGILAVGAALLAGRAESVYQIGTSDSHPCKMERVIELIGLYLQEQSLEGDGSGLRRFWKANQEPEIVSKESFRLRARLAGRVTGLAAGKARELAGLVATPRLRDVLESAADRIDEVAADTRKAADLWEIFLPFSCDHNYRFVTANIRRLCQELGEPAADDPLDWRSYWLDIHIPGLRRHVLAATDRPAGGHGGARRVVTRASLLERLEEVARSDGYRAAITWCTGDRPVSWTYAQLWERTAPPKACSPGVAGPADGAPGAETIAPDPDGRWICDFLAALRDGRYPRLTVAPALAGRELTECLAALSEQLHLRERGGVVVASEVPEAASAALAALYARGELWLVAPGRLDDALAASCAEVAVIGLAAPTGPGRLRTVLDLAPWAGRRRLQPLLDREIEIVSPLSAETQLPHPDAEIAWNPLAVKLCDAQGVAAARILTEPRLAIVRPDLTAFEDFRRMRTAMEKLLADLNADLPHSERLGALLVTLALDLDALAASWESRQDWIRISARDGRQPDWEALPDDRIPQGDLEDETRRLARGLLAPDDLAFVFDCHRDGPATFERLVVLERALIRTLRKMGDGRFLAQAFLQDHVREDKRTRSWEYRTAYRAGTWLRRWGDWWQQDDPQGRLLPELLTEPISRGLEAVSRAFFDRAMQVSVRGEAYLPTQGSFVVVANHSSHLDTGVIQYALGPWGDRLRALAARDYFFGTPARRFAARHFTRLIPVDRKAVTTEWIKQAHGALAAGDCVLIFPEGTRTATPDVKAFKGSLGTLLRACQAPVLPVYVHGTHEILPKGALLPKGRRISVHIGPLMSWDTLARQAGADGTLAMDRAIAAYVQRAVAALPEGHFFWLDDSRSAIPERRA